MEQNTPTFPNIVQSLDKLKILLFWEILKSNNPLLLDGDYMPDKEYTEEQKQYVVQVWERLWDSYYQLKNDAKSKHVLEQSYNEMLLMQKINVLAARAGQFEYIKMHLDILPVDKASEMKQTVITGILNVAANCKVRIFEDVDFNIKAVTRVVDALTNEYNRKKKSTEKQIDAQVDNVFSVIAKVGKIVGFQLNAHTMAVTEWIAYEQMAKDIIKAEEAERQKNKRKR